MPIAKLFRRNRRAQDVALKLYNQIVAQARRPEFYSRHSVPDTIDGRFDMIVVHMFLVLHRLKCTSEEGRRLSQALFDLMFQDMDRSLRELGVGDHAISRRIKQMVQAFYGRLRAYEQAVDGGDAELIDALLRNVYRDLGLGSDLPRGLANYFRRQLVFLATQESQSLLLGIVHFSKPNSNGST